MTICLALGTTQPKTVAVAAACAIIPDLDSRQSISGRLLPMISGPLSYHVGHRTLTHSLIFQLALTIVVWLSMGQEIATAVAAGLVSHAFADMLTKSGVCWFWPSRVRCVLPGSARYRFETGSWAELAFASTMAALSFLLVWMNNTAAGTGGVIRSAIGDIGAARQQYDEQKGSHIFVLRLKGRDNDNLSAVEGEFPVIAKWAADGFLIMRDGRSVSVCKGEPCHIYPEHSVLVVKEPVQTTTLNIEEKSLTASELKRVIQSYQNYGKVYLRGSYRGRSGHDGITVRKNGDDISLYYAQPGVLPDKGYLYDINVSVQIQHKVDARLPRLPDLNGAPSEVRISPLLEKWL